MRVAYAAAVYGTPEVNAVRQVLKNPLQLAAGHRVKEFESKIARLFGKKIGVMVNSGSSANLIAVESLQLPRGSEVITPVLTFATTVAPLLQNDLVPVFTDVEEGTYLANIDEVRRRITKKTRAIMLPSLLGNVPDLKRIASIAKKHNLKVIEDSCDTLGGRFAGKPTGAYSDVSTTSFYASHIITAAAGGGMACFNDPVLARRATVIANWGRESTLFGVYEESEALKKRFAGRLDGEVYDAKFIFSQVGYNFQSTELNAAFGLEQLKRLPSFARARRSNFAELVRFFKQYEHLFVLPKQHPSAETTWLAFPLEIRSGASFSRHEITEFLERNGIQTRPIFTGNIFKQPGFAKAFKKSAVAMHAYPVADRIMKRGFLIGAHHGMTRAQMNYLKKKFHEFLSK
ncbi:MAG: NDP-hexose 3,4-dehydratase [Parcubacteria group bacterium GW2011_GWA2_51_10]|nr:MAG: NDP-hexose 3,4-dehydratase [Parcubacteria group bacterium GW2011_GWA2_51_10]